MMERLTVKDEEFEQVYVTEEKIYKTWSADIYAHIFKGDAIKKLAEYEDLAEVFEKKITSEVFEILKDKEEFAMWLNRVLWSVRKLDEYTRAEEQGLLLRLPCKVGDTVYSITWWDDKTERIKVKGKIYYRTVREHKVTKEKFSLSYLYKFGEEVFLTKKEAEAKLEELRGDSDEV